MKRLIISLLIIIPSVALLTPHVKIDNGFVDVIMFGAFGGFVGYVVKIIFDIAESEQ